MTSFLPSVFCQEIHSIRCDLVSNKWMLKVQGQGGAGGSISKHRAGLLFSTCLPQAEAVYRSRHTDSVKARSMCGRSTCTAFTRSPINPAPSPIMGPIHWCPLLCTHSRHLPIRSSPAQGTVLRPGGPEAFTLEGNEARRISESSESSVMA